jgi:hypothetical protein
MLVLQIGVGEVVIVGVSVGSNLDFLSFFDFIGVCVIDGGKEELGVRVGYEIIVLPFPCLVFADLDGCKVSVGYNDTVGITVGDCFPFPFPLFPLELLVGDIDIVGKLVMVGKYVMVGVNVGCDFIFFPFFDNCVGAKDIVGKYVMVGVNVGCDFIPFPFFDDCVGAKDIVGVKVVVGACVGPDPIPFPPIPIPCLFDPIPIEDFLEKQPVGPLVASGMIDPELGMRVGLGATTGIVVTLLTGRLVGFTVGDIVDVVGKNVDVGMDVVGAIVGSDVTTVGVGVSA